MSTAVVLDFVSYAGARSAQHEQVISSQLQLRGLLHALDALNQCFAFYDRMGRVHHASGAYMAELESTGDGSALANQVSQYAQFVAALAQAARLGAVIKPFGSRTTVSARGHYELNGTYVGLDLFGHGASVLIVTTPPPIDHCTAEYLSARFQLTRGQARVARQLALGLRNAEIAERLFLSCHTVRHHVEQIRLKVGGHTRAAVAARLRGQV